jgi:hypothetical protein
MGAAKGAVAVWTGNPDALVIVEGFIYATHLKHVISRPMKFAQDCLFSRVVYENHDYSFFVFEFLDWLTNPFSWWTITQDLQAMGHIPELDENCTTNSEGQDPGHCEDAEGYERFKESRISSFLFLHTEGRAPVWTGEIGTNRRNATDCYWQYLLKMYKEFDYSWCYWPVDPIRGPIDNAADTYGIFDARFKDYKAVVGWKVQDLISIQGTRSDFPSSAPVQQPCEFDRSANELSVQSVTTLWEMITTTNWSLWTLIWLLLVVLPFVAVGGSVAYGVYLYRQSKTAAAAPDDQASLLENTE